MIALHIGALISAFIVGYFIAGLARSAALPIREAGCYKEGDVVIFETDMEMSPEAVHFVSEQSVRELEPFGVKAVLLQGGVHSRKFVGTKPCPMCGKDLARSRSEETDSLRSLTFNGRRIASITLYGDLSGDFTLCEHDGA